MPETIAAIRELMDAEGLPTDGPRPRHIDIYEKARIATQQ